MRTIQVFRLVLCLALVVVVCGACRAMEDVWEKPVTLELTDVDVCEALTTLLMNSGLAFSIAPDVRGTLPPMSLRDVPFRQALDDLAKAADLVYSVENNVVTIRRRTSDMWQELVSLQVKDMPLADALETLLGDAGINYTINPNVNDLKVTAVLRNVNVKTALKQVLKAAGAVASVQNDSVSVKRKPPATGLPGYAFGTTPDGHFPPASAGILVTEVVELKYVGPGQIAPLLVQPGWLEVQSVSGGKLVLRGSEAALQEAKALIEALDDESALPRAVRVHLSAKVTIAAEGKEPATIESTQVIVAGDGQNAYAAMSGDSPGTSQAPTYGGYAGGGYGGVGQGANTVEVRVTPTVGRDGRIGLSGSLTFRYDLGTENGRPRVLSSPGTTFAASLEPGKPQEIASVGLGSSEDAGKAVVVVTATAAVEEGRVSVPPGGWQREPFSRYGGGSRRW